MAKLTPFSPKLVLKDPAKHVAHSFHHRPSAGRRYRKTLQSRLQGQESMNYDERMAASGGLPLRLSSAAQGLGNAAIRVKEILLLVIG